MQPCDSAFQSVLESGIDPGSGVVVRDLVWLFEFYEYDILPGADGFDPVDASERFASIEITWLGLAYRRVVLSASPITKAKGAQTNRCTLRLSNADENRYAANWVNSTTIEGMRLVVRLISRSASTTLAASNQRFSGRCDPPEGFDATQGSISATEAVGDDDVEWPPRVYLADDPEGRSPSDPLNEGFPYHVIQGSFQYRRLEPDRDYSRRDPRRYFGTLPYSSYDDTPLGEPIPMVGGRTQMRLARGIFLDTGFVTYCLDFACMGPIAGFENFRMEAPPSGPIYFGPLENITYHLGEAGNTGTQTHDPLWPNHPYFSYTAYVGYKFTGLFPGAATTVNAGEATVAVVLGLICPLPDSSGVYNQSGWSDDGADLMYLFLTGSHFFNLDPAFLEDSSFAATRQINQEPLIDQSNSGMILIPDPESAVAGVDFQRYRATGLIGVARAKYSLGLSADRPESLAVDNGDFEPFVPEIPPLIPVDVTRLCKRFTTNFILKKRVKARDFIHKTLLPSFRGYLVMNWRGKWEQRSERPADFAHLRSATLATATALPVEDVTPWKTGSNPLWGQILIGTPLTTSEVRKVTAAAYTSDANAITLSASKSGAVTASASGATLSGGNSTTKATGTVTIGGSPAAGDTVTVTINGLSVTYTVESSETTATVAYMVAAFINAHTQLRRFVSAAASGSVVTVSSRWGVLTLSSALANGHGGPVSNPTSAPSTSVSGSGSSLQAGTYRVAYANRNANGSTYVSPYSSSTITAGQRIVVGALALPAGVTSRDWFVSKDAGDPEMVLHTNTSSGASFDITAKPSSTASFPPEYNTTGEELVRVAMSFASNNQTAAILAQANLTRGNIFAGSYKWPGGRDQASYTAIEATYVSAKDDFAESKVILVNDAKRERLGKRSPLELNLTAVDGFNQARRLSYFHSAKLIDHHWFNQFGAGGLALLLEEGDVICASDDSGGHVNVLTQIEELTINLADFSVSIGRARQYTTQMLSLELVPRTNPVRPSVLRWVTTLATELQFIDVPFFRARDAAAGSGALIAIHRATGSGDWQGSTIWLNFGDGYQEVMSLDVEAVKGESSNTLADHVPGLDTTSTVRVILDNPSDALEDATEDELRAGKNLVRLAGEIFQYKTKTPVGGTDDTYDLTYLIRGLYGTENETGNHTSSDPFTVLDGRVFHLPIPPEFVGKEIGIKAVTTNQDVGDATEHLVTWEGRSELPWPPARVETDPDTNLAPRDAVGNIYMGVWPTVNLTNIGDEYRYDPREDDGSEIDGAFEVFKEGDPMPAMLISNVSGAKYTGIVSTFYGNTLTNTSGLVTRNAKSLQRIIQPDNFCEGTLRAGSSDMFVRFGLLAAHKDWQGASPFDYYFLLGWDGSAMTLSAHDPGGALVASEDASSYYSTGKRVQLRLVGNKVQFIVDPNGEGARLFAESAVLPNYPLVVTARLANIGSSSGAVEKIMMTTNPLPGVIITKEQQEEWYGGLKNPMRVHISQNSRLGFGAPLDVEI